MLTCRKTYRDIPFAHRQPWHDGHCALIHGHNWAIGLTFACSEPDANGFVVDFGRLKYVKRWIDEHLDHACVLAVDDPLKGALIAAAPEAFKLYEVPCTSCEGLAQHLWQVFNELVMRHESGRVWVTQVELWEDSRNAATFVAPVADAEPRATWTGAEQAEPAGPPGKVRP